MSCWRSRKPRRGGTGPEERPSRRSIGDPGAALQGEFVADRATMSWSAQTEDFSFVSRAADTSHSGDSRLGRERNGRFFGTGEHIPED